MIKLLIISDFTEAFPHKLLKGMVNYSRQRNWAIYRMPPGYKRMYGMNGLLSWLKDNKGDAVLGQFDINEDVNILGRNGIVAVAQDYRRRFSGIPNITADYIAQGRMAARFFIERGFKNFGFFGFNSVCWSEERCEGFRLELIEAGFGNNFYPYNLQNIDQPWFYEKDKLDKWLHSIPKPIAIMACDDNQGTNLIAACGIRGIKIPSEISVMGVDNDETLCSLASVPLSSIQIDIEDGGYRTAKLIEKMVKDPNMQPEDIVLHHVKIVERLSTAAYATDDVQIQKAIHFIHNNYLKKISVEDVLAEVALSRRLLERRFKDVTGKSIYLYISDLRIKRFAELLTENDEQIISIALSLGESDTKSISRRFKQIYGCSPGQWRELHQKKTE